MNAVGRPIVEMPSRREDRMRYRQTPFIIVLLVVLALITYIPQLVLWLPHLTQAGS